MTIQRRIALLLPLTLVLVFGCSTKGTIARLSGSVKYKGTPVKAGTVTLTAKEGGVYNIPINSDGTYSSSQLPAGDYEVAIETESANPSRAKQAMQYGGGRGKGMSSPAPEGVNANAGPKAEDYVKIPAKYADPKQSGLTLNLTRGSNKKDFDLTD